MPQFLHKLSRYWLFQAIGWGMFMLINVFFAGTYDRLDDLFLSRLMVFVTMGVLFTHLMRLVIRRAGLLSRSLEVQVGGLLLLNLLFSFIIGILDAQITSLLDIRLQEEMQISERIVVLSHTFYAFVYLFIWNMIYFMFHYINKSRSQQLDTLKLQALVKELELKTIKSHINPHFIFNALNSIRALIDEDPERARHAVTALSNILRSSMQAENIETVPLNRELGIVSDYLALEHIRFEDRLKVEYQIDEDTLHLLVPYMMVQTLVENGIKHGIGRLVTGGVIQICSKKEKNGLMLIIRNTGRLREDMNREGFGLQSTASRLLLLFGSGSTFEIHNLATDMVEAKVYIPVP